MKSIDMHSPQQALAREQQQLDSDTIAAPLRSTETEKLREVGEAHQTLARSLDTWENDQSDVSYEEQVTVDKVINDAHNLAANILPASAVAELGIPAERHDDIGFEHPPMLSDLFLLVRAYDDTQDETLKRSVEYILDEVPPNLSEPLVKAYQRAEAYRSITGKDDLIMDEYRTIANNLDNYADKKIDEYYTKQADKKTF